MNARQYRRPVNGRGSRKRNFFQYEEELSGFSELNPALFTRGEVFLGGGVLAAF
jgi:hypothetical protein